MALTRADLQRHLNRVLQLSLNREKVYIVIENRDPSACYGVNWSDGESVAAAVPAAKPDAAGPVYKTASTLETSDFDKFCDDLDKDLDDFFERINQQSGGDTRKESSLTASMPVTATPILHLKSGGNESDDIENCEEPLVTIVAPGDRVRIVGVKNQVKYNGMTGIVQKLSHEVGKFVVTLDPGRETKVFHGRYLQEIEIDDGGSIGEGDADDYYISDSDSGIVHDELNDGGIGQRILTPVKESAAPRRVAREAANDVYRVGDRVKIKGIKGELMPLNGKMGQILTIIGCRDCYVKIYNPPPPFFDQQWLRFENLQKSGDGGPK